MEKNTAATECTAKEPTHIDDSTLNKQLFIVTALGVFERVYATSGKTNEHGIRFGRFLRSGPKRVKFP